MSSTNKTTNYNLSQYIGSDKPTYLSDYNSDMFEIDKQMKINADNVATAIQGATDAGTLASTANATATTANTNANTAIANNATTQSQLNSFMTKFNLNTRISWLQADVSFPDVGFTNIEECRFTLAKNSDGSIFKLYGSISGTTTSVGRCNIVLNNTGITVDTPYEIFPAGVCSPSGSNADMPLAIVVENNKMTVSWWNYGADYVKLALMPCIYFNADFGDVSNNNN